MSSINKKISYRLEMTDRSQLQPKRVEIPQLELHQIKRPSPAMNWFLHQSVGAAFRWGGREDWDQQRWAQYVDRPELETWVAYVEGAPAGYFELEHQADASIEIKCFGLLSDFFGQGLGGHLLTAAVNRAWDAGAKRVWLRTCSHDHAHALSNYLHRGFRLVEQTTGPPNQARESALFRTFP